MNLDQPDGGCPESNPARLSAPEQNLLLALARQTLRNAVTGGGLPSPAATGLPPRLLEPKACFVTLTINGALRGCIGGLFPQEPLYRAVIESARNAALHDPRFDPVAPPEVDQIAIEISVLTMPQQLVFSSPAELLARLQPGRDGVILRIRSGSATYLPQVWEEIPDKEAFLHSLAEKAGGPAFAWREPGTAVSTYQVEWFNEPAPHETGRR